MMYKRVLFATDFDEVGILAAHKAKKIADENRADLILVHVVEPIPAYAYPGFAGFAEVELSIREQAEKELNDFAEKLGVDSKHRFIEFGSTKNEILRVATEHKIDLVITFDQEVAQSKIVFDRASKLKPTAFKLGAPITSKECGA